jgi:glycosyltransferase involved in cell wall biosynthesis
MGRNEYFVKDRLAIFLPDLTEGGAQRVVLNLACGIAERGYAVDLVLVRAVGPYLAEVPAQVRVINLGASRILACLPALVRYLRREKPKAFLSATSYSNVVALWARRLSGISTNLIVSEHSVPSEKSQSSSNWRVKWMPQLRKFYRWADSVVAVSRAVGDDLNRVIGLHRENIKVIYNPVITPDLKEKVKLPVDHPWYKPGHPPVLLAVGRLAPEKDFATLIRGFAELRKTRSLRLLILGEGPERSVFENLVRQLGLEQDISLPGFVPNPYSFMTLSSVFILSSTREALPTVLIEALYCGIPCIATDCPGGTREILQNGRFGKLVPTKNSSALAEAINLALNGEVPSPAPESWLPFERDGVVQQYLGLLLGN